MKINSNKFKIKVVGIGDFGIRVIKDFDKKHLPNVECFDMNTDWAFETANKFIKIGTKTTNGFGAGAVAVVGEKAAQEDKQEIVYNLKDCQLLFVVAGLGGGTGSGASPVVAETAKELGIPTIAFVSTPPKLERKIRGNNAQYGFDKLRKNVDILLELPLENMENLCTSKTGCADMYREAEKILQEDILNVINLFNLEISRSKPITEIFKLIKKQFSQHELGMRIVGK